jgi:hypothetical protein
LNEPAETPVPARKGWRATWRGDLMRIVGVVSITAILLVLAWYGQYYLKFLGPPQNCWEYKEMEGKLYKVNPCTGQFQLVGDAPPPESGK